MTSKHERLDALEERVSVVEGQAHVLETDVAELDSSDELQSKGIQSNRESLKDHAKDISVMRERIEKLEARMEAVAGDVRIHDKWLRADDEQRAVFRERIEKSSHDYEQVRLIAKDMAQRPPVMSPALVELVRCAKALRERRRGMSLGTIDLRFVAAVDALDAEGGDPMTTIDKTPSAEEAEAAKAALENTASWLDLDWKEGGRICSAVRDAQVDDLATISAFIAAHKDGRQVWLDDCVVLDKANTITLYKQRRTYANTPYRLIKE